MKKAVEMNNFSHGCSGSSLSPFTSLHPFFLFIPASPSFLSVPILETSYLFIHFCPSQFSTFFPCSFYPPSLLFYSLAHPTLWLHCSYLNSNILSFNPFHHLSLLHVILISIFLISHPPTTALTQLPLLFPRF